MLNYFTDLWSLLREDYILIYIYSDVTSLSFNEIILALLIAFIVGMIALRLGRDLYR